MERETGRNFAHPRRTDRFDVAMELYRNGALARRREINRANAQAIAKSEDWQLSITEIAHWFNPNLSLLADLDRIIGEIGTFPLIIRPAFTLGGTGGGIAYNRESSM